MDSDAEGVPSEFFDYFKVSGGVCPAIRLYLTCMSQVSIVFFVVCIQPIPNVYESGFNCIFVVFILVILFFRFYASKVFSHVENMQSVLFFLLRCCR